MLLFGEKNPLVSRNQAQGNLFAVTEVGKRVENKNYDAMIKQRR